MNILTAFTNGTSGTLWMDIPTFVFGNSMYIVAYMCLIATFIWSLPRPEDREDDDLDSSDDESDEIDIPKNLRDMLTEEELEYISDKYNDIVRKTVDDAKKLNISDESTPEQVLMKMKPLLVSMFREMRGLTTDKVDDGEIEVETISSQPSFSSKPTEGIKYDFLNKSTKGEKLEEIGNKSEQIREPNITGKYDHIIGKSYVKGMEEVAKDGYKLHILYVGRSAQKYTYTGSPSDKVINVWIDDKDYDYYKNIPTEMAEIKEIIV